MKHLSLVCNTLAASLLLLMMSNPALAAEESCSGFEWGKGAKENFDKALGLVKAGKPREALPIVGKVAFCEPCGGTSFCTTPSFYKDVFDMRRRLLLELGDQEEKKGNFYTGIARQASVFSRGLYSPDFIKQAGAFEFYSEVGTDSALPLMDKMIVKYARVKGDDAAAAIALAHLVAHEHDRRKMGGTVMKDHEAHVQEMIAIRLKDIDSAINNEPKAFNAKETDALGNHPYAISLKLLEQAKTWAIERRQGMAASLAAPFVEREKQIIATAEKRGDTILGYPDPAPQALGYAEHFYELAGSKNKLPKVRERANAPNKGQKKLTEQQVGEMKSSVKRGVADMKDENKKKQREKEKDDLEKDLGL